MDSQEMMKTIKPQEIHLVSTTTDDCEEYNLLLWALNHSSIVGLDAEWACSNEIRIYTFPTVALLQIACRINDEHLEDRDSQNKILVFLVDLQEIVRLSSTLTSIYQLLKDLFASPHILKLGFSFKQDFTYLSSTFASHGFPPGFDKLAPFVDISTLYHEGQLQQKQPGEEISKNLKGLATVCKEVIGVTLSKELQCSDWSFRPLTEDQKTYATVDAQCLLEIFDVFEEKVLIEEASNFNASRVKTAPPRISLLNIIGRYGEKNFLKHFDRKPKTPKQPPQPFSKKTRKKMQKLAAPLKIRKSSTSADTTKEAKFNEGCGNLQEAKLIESRGDLQEPPPGDSSLVILAPPGPPEDSSLITLSTPPQQLSKKSRRTKKKMQSLALPV
ncbi:exonuclease mut-7 homolog isoform X1 [Papaver somniferum]|uniref:exonuclease mut-7 homolog isoform X1 n=1 Tax=Papaver somniferum TaxID=3469 RepID=UPI000E702E7D|nr:exonuclease mut-7 homolog isoform X1 [Papaver somniferum]